MKLLLVDDHPIFLAGARFVLERLDDSLAIDDAGDCAEALVRMAASHYDLILLDYNLPDRSGLDALAAVRAAIGSTDDARGTAVVIVSADDSRDNVVAAVEAGAAGFVSKTVEPGVLLAALRVVVAGGTYLPTSLLQDPPRVSAPNGGPDLALLRSLTPRQLDVLRGAVAAKSNKVIARELDIAEQTVKRHLSEVYAKLEVSGRTELAIAAARLDLDLGA